MKYARVFIYSYVVFFVALCVFALTGCGGASDGSYTLIKREDTGQLRCKLSTLMVARDNYISNHKDKPDCLSALARLEWLDRVEKITKFATVHGYEDYIDMTINHEIAIGMPETLLWLSIGDPDRQERQGDNWVYKYGDSLIIVLDVDVWEPIQNRWNTPVSWVKEIHEL